MKRFLLPATILLTLALACAGDPPATREATPEHPVAVQVATAATRVMPRITQASGTVEALRRVSPGTKILGRVDQVLVREGDAVVRGQLLARLESRDLEAAVTQAQAGVSMAEANLENARTHHRRMVDLHERGSVTDKNLEDVTAAFRVAEASLEQAHANLEVARVNLAYAEVRSPIDGWLIRKQVEAGDMAQPGAPLFTVEDTRQVKVDVRVSETDVEDLAVGSRAKVVIVGRHFEAAVDRVVPAGDPASRTFSVQFLLDNPGGELRSGMFARVSFGHGEQEVMCVPDSALVTRGQLVGLFVVDDGHARLRWIKTGRRNDDGPVVLAEVLSGLQVGERYVVDPTGLVDGAAVEVH